MGIGFDITTPEGWHAARAALLWQIELGATEAIGDDPVNAYDLPERLGGPIPPAAAAPISAPGQAAAMRSLAPAPPDNGGDAAIAAARALAEAAPDIAALRAALDGFDQCDLRLGARNLVFAEGRPGARVLVLTDTPSREAEREGRPLAGAEGAFFDAMFAAIGLSRHSPDTETGLYLVSALPWRPPAGRDPTPAEAAMLRPFVERHVALADPQVIVAMGNAPCALLLGAKAVIRLRGNWAEFAGRPVLPMLSPAATMARAEAKRAAWADLLSLKQRLRP